MSLAGSSRFHPIELSDPIFERDHPRNLTFYSPSLQGRGDVSLFIPPGLDRAAPFPVVILLHGVYGSHWAWFLKGGAHLIALDLIQRQQIRPVMIVAPSDGLRGDGTGYLPGLDQNYESWIAGDLIQCIEEVFCAPATAADVFIAGLSMGGYGALRIGAKYPERFCGVSAHSAMTRVDQFDAFVRDTSRFQSASPDLDPLYWLQLNREKLPPLRFDCGRDDALFESNLAFHQELKQLQIPHVFETNPGDHSWSYWQTYLGNSFLFFEHILHC